MFSGESYFPKIKQEVADYYGNMRDWMNENEARLKFKVYWNAKIKLASSGNQLQRKKKRSHDSYLH